MVVSRLRPKYFLPAASLCIGSTACCMSLVNTPAGVYGLRIALGLSEAVFVPSLVFIIGSWYTKDELAKRTALYLTGNEISGAVGGLIAGAISSTLDGAMGRSGWRWLFIIEGAMAIVVGLTGFFLLPDYPNNTPWICGEERACALLRLERQGRKATPSNCGWNTIKNLLCTPYIYILVITYICIHISNSIPLNFVIIIKKMGYDTSFSNYIVTPIYLVSATCAILFAWASDRYNERMWIIIIVETWVAIWYLILSVVDNGNNSFSLILAGAFMVILGIPLFPIFFTFVNEIYSTDTNTRALAIATVSCTGNLVPNFLSIAIWAVTDAPVFRLGKFITFLMSAIAVVLMLITRWMLKNDVLMPQPLNTTHEKTVALEE
ncbi:major facilitator superfamily domain-containing protein [Spinellus fusiger]|nr:major facilitator superfamily domain-containing protein [Spinellus fusiger]